MELLEENLKENLTKKNPKDEEKLDEMDHEAIS